MMFDSTKRVLKFLSLSAITNSAMASGIGQGAQSSTWSSMILLFVMFIAMYFLAIRPQQKKAKQHRDLINSIAKGDEVVTSAGILGKVNKLSDEFIVLELDDKVEITVQRHAVALTLPKGTMKSIQSKVN